MWLCTIIGRVCFCTCKLRQIPRSWDRSIVVHDESSKTEVVHRRATNSHKARRSTIQIFLGSSEIPGWSETVLDDKLFEFSSSPKLLWTFFLDLWMISLLEMWESMHFAGWHHLCGLQAVLLYANLFSAIAVVHVWWHNPPPVGIAVAKHLQLFQTFRELCIIFVCLLS